MDLPEHAKVDHRRSDHGVKDRKKVVGLEVAIGLDVVALMAPPQRTMPKHFVDDEAPNLHGKEGHHQGDPKLPTGPHQQHSVGSTSQAIIGQMQGEWRKLRNASKLSAIDGVNGLTERGLGGLHERFAHGRVGMYGQADVVEDRGHLHGQRGLIDQLTGFSAD